MQQQYLVSRTEKDMIATWIELDESQCAASDVPCGTREIFILRDYHWLFWAVQGNQTSPEECLQMLRNVRPAHQAEELMMRPQDNAATYFDHPGCYTDNPPT
jgi:hypothetical protein